MPEREPKGAASPVLRHAHRQQHVTGLRNPGLAGGAGGALDSRGVQQVEQRVTVTPGHKQVRIARQTSDAVAWLPVAGHLNSETRLLGATNQLVAQGNQPFGPGLPVGYGMTHGHGKAANRRGVEAAASDLTLLTPAMRQRHQGRVTSSQQRADTLRSTDLVPADAHQVKPAAREVDLDLAEALDGVAVHRDAELVGNSDDVGDWLNGPDLVVGPHHADQGDRLGVGPDGGADGLGMDPADVVNLEPGDLGALVGFKKVDTVQDCVMLDRADQKPDPPWIGVPACPEGAFDGQVVRLRAPEVKRTSEGRAPMAWAIVSRDSSTTRRPRRPEVCRDEALPTIAI